MISVVIPTYKNVEQLKKMLSHNLPFLEKKEVIVVNDYPGDDLSALETEFPIKLIQNEKNLGFSGSVNRGVEKATERFVFLLNSDVLLPDDSYKHSLAHFHEKNNLFAVSFSQKEKDGRIVGRNSLFWQNGLLLHRHNPENKTGITAWAEGGSTIIDRHIFNTLGGFDIIYSPFYWEDIDLSYRAWKRGYSVLYDADVLVEHHHESTIATHFQQNLINKIAYRNQLLCMWKNITDASFISDYRLQLPKHLLRHVLAGDLPFVQGFWEAVQKRNQIAIIEAQQFVLTDHEILAQFE